MTKLIKKCKGMLSVQCIRLASRNFMAFDLAVYILLLKREGLMLSSIRATLVFYKWARARVPRPASASPGNLAPAFDLGRGPAICIFIGTPSDFKACQNLRATSLRQFGFSKVSVSFGRYFKVT